MHAFFGRWKDYERTFGVTFYEMLKRDAAYAKVRRYPDSLARALDADNLPRAVYDTLIAQSQRQPADAAPLLPAAREAARRRDLRYYDIYPPLVHERPQFPIERSRQLLLRRAAPARRSRMSPRWRRRFDERLDGRLSAAAQALGRAYVNAAYDVHPYVLMNYNDDYESLTTLAHEWGHAMHSHLANQAQPFVTADYATFIAEIASTLERGAAARPRAEDRGRPTTSGCSTSARRWRRCAAPSSARRCSPSSSATCTRASTAARR